MQKQNEVSVTTFCSSQPFAFQNNFLINLLFSGLIYNTILSPCTFTFALCVQLYLIACAHLYLFLSRIMTFSLALFATWFYLHTSFSLLLKLCKLFDI